MTRIVFTQSLLVTLNLMLIGLVMAGGRIGDRGISPLESDPACRLPCWSGIHPGHTALSDATQILIRSGYQVDFDDEHNHYTLPPGISGCRVTLYWLDTVVHQMQLENCPDLRLGDLLLDLDRPDRVSPIYLTFDQGDGFVRVQMIPFNCAESLSPHTRVQQVVLSAGQLDPTLSGGESPWQGFAPRWRYTRATPRTITLC